MLIGGYLGYDYYQKIFSPNVPTSLKSEYVHVPTGSTFEEVVDLLVRENTIIDKSSFEWVADRMNYIKNPMRAGRYKIAPNMSNRALIQTLRSHKQSPVNLIIHNKRTIDQVAGLLGNLFESDSLDFLAYLTNPHNLTPHDLTLQTAMTTFIPNTYHLYWTTTPKGVFERMIQERDKFWTANRKAKAKKLGLSTKEVYTLASIVESETRQNTEKSRVAGVYLNRLEKGMLLQADPTVVFAVGDFTLRRVLKRHLEVNSPYNTYKYKGLPPGPIYMASIASIDRTLDAENHDYLYFCAKPGGGGFHAFAKTLQGHNVNAARYHRWLKEQKIR